jgi:hypothetical protein
VWWTLVIVSLLLGMMTRQWLLRNTLINPPSYDALVYHNQSYDDLLLLEAGGWKKYLEKYTAGNWHVPPLYMTLGTGAHLLLGLPAANAYAINVIFFFVFSWSLLCAVSVCTSRPVCFRVGHLPGCVHTLHGRLRATSLHDRLCGRRGLLVRHRFAIADSISNKPKEEPQPMPSAWDFLS